MSNIVQKVKDALHGEHHRTADTAATSHDSTHRGNTTGTTGVGSTTTDTYGSGNTAGPHRSDAANKLDPRVDSDRDGSHRTGGTTNLGGTGTHHEATSYGPHQSNVANKIDPLVGSDRDGTHRVGGTGGYSGGGYNTTTTTGVHQPGVALNKPYDSTTTGTHTGALGATGAGAGLGGFGVGSGLGGTHHTQPGYSSTTTGTTAGPYSSNLANKLDPRVDSDRDAYGSNTYGTGTGTGLTGATATHHGVGTGTYGTTGHGSATTAGPYQSNLGNKLDPRVDSDRDGDTTHGTGTGTGTTGTGPHHTSNTAPSHMLGIKPINTTSIHSPAKHGAAGDPSFANTSTTGTTSTGLASSNHGPHASNAGNKLDPRFDSDRDHRAKSNLVATATGPAPNTAGPHTKDWANKLDPRVDSDLDGSKTYGGDRTTAGTGTDSTATGTGTGTGTGAGRYDA